jgi:integrase
MLGAARQKKGLSVEDLRAVVSDLGDRPIEVRDRALQLVGFAGGFRRSELAGLDVADLVGHPAGLLVRLRASKTDQEDGRPPSRDRVRIRSRDLPGARGAPVDRPAGRRGSVAAPVNRHGHIAPTRFSAQQWAWW